MIWIVIFIDELVKSFDQLLADEMSTKFNLD